MTPSPTRPSSHLQSMRLVECVPNFSEGRRSEIIAAIRDAIAAVDGVAILDTSSDLSHNRTVVTFVVPIERAVDAAFAGIRKAREVIDLNHHSGEHPRMGAADVVPFIPLEGTTMEDCIVLARSLGERVGRELEIPVFLYERAATRPDRENLADVRRGEFEGLRAQMGTDPARVPDRGPNAGRFPGTTGVNNPEPPCNSANNGSGATNPLFCANPSAPDRKQPYREITIIYHEVGQVATQAFPVFSDPSLGMVSTINAGFDGFAINYGTGGIGAEVYANRIGVGPMGSCVDCKFEEFFLSAWSVGDPAMLVDRPANSSVLPAFTTAPAEPPVPNSPPSTTPPVLCTAAQLGDTGAAPDPNCANARVPVPGAVNGLDRKSVV